ncbi:MAG: hypothetical protein LBJ61_04995 [Deltaproteobacteria bacterium]|nr:hypothetical protein [Deltaproteobacteria bacterium]
MAQIQSSFSQRLLFGPDSKLFLPTAFVWPRFKGVLPTAVVWPRFKGLFDNGCCLAQIQSLFADGFCLSSIHGIILETASFMAAVIIKHPPTDRVPPPVF